MTYLSSKICVIVLTSVTDIDLQLEKIVRVTP